MWTPTFPGLLPGKNRVVCLGFGGKSVPRNVTLWGAWGGLARRPCISQLLRLRDNLGGQGSGRTLSNAYPLSQTYKTHCWHNTYCTSRLSPRDKHGHREALSSPSVPPHMPHTRHFTVWTTDPFWLNITPLNDKSACWEALRLTHPLNDWNKSITWWVICNLFRFYKGGPERSRTVLPKPVLEDHSSEFLHCIPHRTKVIYGNNMRASELWQNFHLCLNCSFKSKHNKLPQGQWQNTNSSIACPGKACKAKAQCQNWFQWH